MLKSALLFLVLVSAALVSAQAEDAAARHDLEAFYKKWDRQWSNENVAGLMKMIAPGAYSVTPEGEISSYAGSRKDFTDWFKTTRKMKSHIRVDHAYRNGNELVAWITQTVSYEAKVKAKWTPFSYVRQFAETFKPFPGRGILLVVTHDFPETASYR